MHGLPCMTLSQEVNTVPSSCKLLPFCCRRPQLLNLQHTSSSGHLCIIHPANCRGAPHPRSHTRTVHPLSRDQQALPATETPSRSQARKEIMRCTSFIRPLFLLLGLWIVVSKSQVGGGNMMETLTRSSGFIIHF